MEGLLHAAQDEEYFFESCFKWDCCRGIFPVSQVQSKLVWLFLLNKDTCLFLKLLRQQHLDLAWFRQNAGLFEETMTPVNKIRIFQPVSTKLAVNEGSQISNFEIVASYNWLDQSDPTILVPG